MLNQFTVIMHFEIVDVFGVVNIYGLRVIGIFRTGGCNVKVVFWVDITLPYFLQILSKFILGINAL